MSSPAGSLRGPYLKLKRAGFHLDRLHDDQLAPYIARQKQRITSEVDPRTGDKGFWLDPEPVPSEWGPMIGDVLTNLRSSLDHLARQLVIANGRGASDSFFPLFDDPIDFLCRAMPVLRKLDATGQAILDQAQPYNRANPPQDAALWLLNNLCNIDKHRHLHVTLSVMRAAVAYGGPWQVLRAHHGPIDKRTELLAVAKMHAHVDPTFLLDVAFAECRRFGMPLIVWDFFVEVIDDISTIFTRCFDAGLLAK